MLRVLRIIAGCLLCVVVSAAERQLWSTSADWSTANPLGRVDWKPARSGAVGFCGDGSNRYPDATPPPSFDVVAGTNVHWVADLPGFSNSSPVVLGDRVFTMAEPDWMLCLDRESGKERWRVKVGQKTGIPKDSFPKWQMGCTTATPITNGRGIFARTGLGRVSAFTPSGRTVWETDIPVNGQSTNGSSPQLLGNLLLVSLKHSHAQEERHQIGIIAELHAFDSNSGRRRWMTVVRAGQYNSAQPAVFVNGRTARIVTGGGQVIDPASGRILSDAGIVCGGATPVVSRDGHILMVTQVPDVAQTYYRHQLHYLRLDPASKYTEIESIATHEIGKVKDQGGKGGKGEKSYASPLWVRDHIIGLNSWGMVFVLDCRAGTMRKIRTINGEAYTNPTLVGDKVVFMVTNKKSTESTVYMLDDGFDTVTALGTIPEKVRSNPFAVGTQLFIRGFDRLYCIGS